jgi:hypothetical protein
MEASRPTRLCRWGSTNIKPADSRYDRGTSGGQVRAYVANGFNQYTTAGATSPGYDVNGNLTFADGTTYAYDMENRLTSGAGATNATLTYDPLGRLNSTVGGGVTTRFLYDGDELVGEYDGAGTLLRRYVHGPMPMSRSCGMRVRRCPAAA